MAVTKKSERVRQILAELRAVAPVVGYLLWAVPLCSLVWILGGKYREGARDGFRSLGDQVRDSGVF
jgi:hypothetical protein